MTSKVDSFLRRTSADEKSLSSESDITASQLFASSFAEALIPSDQITGMVVVQQRMLARFERTNALLSTAIEVSSNRLVPPGAPQQMLSFNSGLLDRVPNTDVVQEIRRATVQLGELKERLLNVTRRIRNLKSKCTRLYPEAFGECEKSLGLMALNGQLNLVDDVEEEGKKPAAVQINKEPVIIKETGKVQEGNDASAPTKTTNDKPTDSNQSVVSDGQQ